jgi:hypothetical protein
MSKKLALWFAALVVAACSGSSVSPSTAPASAAATVAPSQQPSAAAATAPVSPSVAASPFAFTSPLYAYGITLPSDWGVGAAILRWDRASAPGSDDSAVDKFASPATVSVFGYAGPVTGDLDRFVKDEIGWTGRDHADTCPKRVPDTTEAIRIGGKAGKLLTWDCGILINQALVVSGGTGFVFVMRDPGIHATTDPTDLALLHQILDSVTLPG